MRTLIIAAALAISLASAAAQPLPSHELNVLTDRVTDGVALPDGRAVALGVYYVPQLKTYFAGPLVSVPRSSGYQILPPFAHWFADDETALIERSQSLKGVLAAHGGLAKFILRLIEHAEEAYIDLSGYAGASEPAAFTTQQLVNAVAQWHQLQTPWGGLMMFWPQLTAPPL